MVTISMTPAPAQQATPPEYPPAISGARVETYKKTVGEVELKVWLFNPEGHSGDNRRPAIIFFFGGGWNRGNPRQFANHCEYLAARGMVAITADYRVRDRHAVKANACVSDAKSAIRWVRQNATRLGIDPDRIAAGGGSSGGHLAAATATLPEHDDPAEDRTVSSQPNALVLFNPGVILAPVPERWQPDQDAFDKFKERLGAEPVTMSPYHHIETGMAPTIIFHGTADKLVPYESVALFREAMLARNNRCDLIGYKGAGHGFFNYGRDENAAFIDTVNKMDAFLVSVGYLKPPPETVSP